MSVLLLFVAPPPPEFTLLFVVVVGAVLGIVGVAAKPVSVGVLLPGAGAAPLWTPHCCCYWW